ncbi:hypothetical protein AB0K18_43045 [Nonomuraea sp. NPDC049421]|uniref:hypothetical protein n=1 Tax=Nonomuraea sp. NPDC049421 TaxID=3155275 RepID=UPI00344364E9
MDYYEQLRRIDRQRRRTNAVLLGTGVAIVAGLITVAHLTDDDVEEVTAVCVTPSPALDGSYQIVDDRFCEGGSHHTYIYYYGGTTTSGSVRGGTTVRPSHAQIVTRSGKVVQRGGFGGRGRSGS